MAKATVVPQEGRAGPAAAVGSAGTGTVDDQGAATRASREFVIVSLTAAVVLLLALAIEVSHTLADWPDVGGWQINTVIVLAALPTAFGIFTWRRWTQLRTEVVERKRAEEALRKSEERLRHLLTAGPAVIYTCKPLGDYGATFISENVAAQMGYEPREFLDDSGFWADLIHPEDAPRVFAGLRRLFEQGHYAHEYRCRHKDGTYRWMRDELKLTRDADGNPVEIVGYWIDTTERKQAEEELRSSQERLTILFESAPDAYYLNDLEGTFVDGNKASEEISGYAREELIGRSFLELNLLPPEQIAKAAAALAKNGRGESTGPDEFTLNREDGGQVTVEIRTFPVTIQGKPLVLGIARDSTVRKQAEEELREAHDELEMRVKERTAELTAVNAQLQQELTERRRAEEALQAAREELEGKVERQILRRNPYRLTFRELTVLHLVSAGRSDREIGVELGISPLTAQKHVENIRSKMDASSRTEAGVRAVREGLLE